MEIRQMPDITVKVTFTAPDTFTFEPETATLNAAGKVILKSKTANPGWTFVSVNNLPSSQFASSLKANNAEIHIDDAFTATGEFGYTVTVHDASGDHTSGQTSTATVPPMIMNQ
jgi:hypothetical protein